MRYTPELLLKPFIFPEAPRWYRDTFYFCDIDAGTMGRITAQIPPMQMMQPDVPTELGDNPELWDGRVNRNAPCPCGSGLKYKHCHGAVTA